MVDQRIRPWAPVRRAKWQEAAQSRCYLDRDYWDEDVRRLRQRIPQVPCTLKAVLSVKAILSLTATCTAMGAYVIGSTASPARVGVRPTMMPVMRCGIVGVGEEVEQAELAGRERHEAAFSAALSPFMPEENGGVQA
ncbi:hypothetical protein GY45DRAFT_379171 [Cubamyces sp. BRFM 1775]|nr:hypothetical protein GY45DRAFT_379171 [Cubamyces sp. BRFM 1775]